VIPANRTIHVRSAQFAWNYTTYLDIVFIVLAVAAWWLARNRALFSAGHGYATDPVCGMQVRLGDAPAELSRVGTSYVFCSDRCRDRFVADPSRFAVEGDRRGAHRHRSPLPSSWRRNWREPDG